MNSKTWIPSNASGPFASLILVAGVVGLAATISGCGDGPAGAAAAAGGPAAGPGGSLVRVAAITEEQVTPKTTVVGTVVAKRTSVVASGADGKVDQFLVREGQVVDEGQQLSILNMVTTDLEIEEARRRLAEIEQEYLIAENGSRPEEIAEAQAKMEAARVTMEITARKLERLQRLVASNASNQDDLDDARERADAAKQMFDAATASYELVLAGPRKEDILAAKARFEAQQKHVDYLLAEREKRITRAPFRGMIVAEHTESGQWLSKGDPVVTVADLLDEVHVIANVDERELRNVQLGATTDVVFETAPNRQWKGKVISIVPRTEWETGSRTVPVKVAVQNEIVETGGGLRPRLSEGMYARVTFHGTPRMAVLVPKNAVIRSESGSKVFAVIPGEAPGTGKAKPVVLVEGSAFGERIEVQEGELPPGTQVVTEGAERLSPFADVVITGQPPQTEGGAPAENSVGLNAATGQQGR